MTLTTCTLSGRGESRESTRLRGSLGFGVSKERRTTKTLDFLEENLRRERESNREWGLFSTRHTTCSEQTLNCRMPCDAGVRRSVQTGQTLCFDPLRPTTTFLGENDTQKPPDAWLGLSLISPPFPCSPFLPSHHGQPGSSETHTHTEACTERQSQQQAPLCPRRNSSRPGTDWGLRIK